MNPDTPKPPEREPLWVCESCERIGEEAEAQKHAEETGHEVQSVPLPESEAVREIWAQERAKNVAALIAYGQLRKSAEVLP